MEYRRGLPYLTGKHMNALGMVGQDMFLEVRIIGREPAHSSINLEKD